MNGKARERCVNKLGPSCRIEKPPAHFNPMVLPKYLKKASLELMSRPVKALQQQRQPLDATSSSPASPRRPRGSVSVRSVSASIGIQLHDLTISSPAPVPYRTGSDRLALTAFFTRSSQTPSQFHSPGRRLRPRVGLPSDFSLVDGSGLGDDGC